MAKITLNSSLADIVAANEMLIPVLDYFDIQLGLGDKSIECVCRENGLQPSLFLCVINTIDDPYYIPAETLQTFSILKLVEYLTKENEHLERELDVLEELIQTFVQQIESQDLLAIENSFQAFKQKFLSFHLKKNEIVFSPIITLYEAYYSPLLKPKDRNKTVLFPDRESDEIYQELLSLKKYLIKEVSGNYKKEILLTLILRLSYIEKEVYNQQQIEKRLLKPLVREMEESIQKKRKGHLKNPRYASHIAISAAKHSVLSTREIEVLRLLSQGLINKEIADKLHISLHTVISHRKKIMEKLSIKTISGLTAYAVKNRIV
jgi:DNA-binding CsgD family transcriptional regulator